MLHVSSIGAIAVKAVREDAWQVEQYQSEVCVLSWNWLKWFPTKAEKPNVTMTSSTSTHWNGRFEYQIKETIPAKRNINHINIAISFSEQSWAL